MLWLNEPVDWSKATCAPSGAVGLPKVKPLLLPLMPAEPEKVHGEPVGRYWDLPVPTDTCSNPGSQSGNLVVAATLSTKAMLSPPALSSPWNVIVCGPAPTVNTEVV